MIRTAALVVITAAAALHGSAPAAGAQIAAGIEPGARVRVWIPETTRQGEGPRHRQLLRGSVQSASPDTLRLVIAGTSGSLAIPAHSVRRIDVSQGVSPVASAIERAAGGAIGGAILWGLMNDPRRTGGPSYRTDWQAAGVGAAWGAGLGAVIGLLFPHERWRRLR